MNSITFFLSFIPILALLLLGINLILAPHNPYQEKSSTFECGFHSFLGQNRTQFNISFFIFGLLFLAFDLELVIALPGLINISGISAYGLSIMLIFFAILTIGFAFELGKKALNIDSRQYNNTLTSWLVCGYGMKNIIINVNISITRYLSGFNYANLITGYIELKIITISWAFFICLYIIPGVSVLNMASYIIIMMILTKFFTLPWGNNNMVSFIITLVFNCIIISFTLSLVLVFMGYSDIFYMTLPISTLLAFNDPFDTQLVLIGSDPLPNDGGFSGGYNGSEGSGDPGNFNKAKLGGVKTDSSNKTQNDEVILTYIKKWFGLEKGHDLRVNLDDKLAEDKVPNGIEQKALKNAFTLFKETADEKCKIDPDLNTLVKKISGNNTHPFDPNNSKVLTGEIDRDLRLGITYAEKLIQDYMKKNNIKFQHRMYPVEYLIEPTPKNLSKSKI